MFTKDNHVPKIVIYWKRKAQKGHLAEKQEKMFSSIVKSRIISMLGLAIVFMNSSD